MLTELLEKFEDVFKPVSDKEMAQRIEQMDADDLVEVIEDTVSGMSESALVELYNVSSFSDVSDLIRKEVVKWVEDAKTTGGKRTGYNEAGMRDLRDIYFNINSVAKKRKTSD